VGCLGKHGTQSFNIRNILGSELFLHKLLYCEHDCNRSSEIITAELGSSRGLSVGYIR